MPAPRTLERRLPRSCRTRLPWTARAPDPSFSEDADGGCRRRMPTENADGECRRRMPTANAGRAPIASSGKVTTRHIVRHPSDRVPRPSASRRRHAPRRRCKRDPRLGHFGVCVQMSSGTDTAMPAPMNHVIVTIACTSSSLRTRMFVAADATAATRTERE